jgi:hypothetical protein
MERDREMRKKFFSTLFLQNETTECGVFKSTSFDKIETIKEYSDEIKLIGVGPFKDRGHFLWQHVVSYIYLAYLIRTYQSASLQLQRITIVTGNWRALAAWSTGNVHACHRKDWCYGA